MYPTLLVLSPQIAVDTLFAALWFPWDLLLILYPPATDP